MALSGGRTPVATVRDVAGRDLPWPLVHVFQVDERVAPDGHPDRNAGLLRDLADRTGLPAANLHLARVADLGAEAAARAYEETLRDVCGTPPVLDLVQLGLGDDGHTASLVPGEPVLEVRDREVAETGVYHGRRRVTLTLPAIDRARQILWIVTGGEKADAIRRLVAGDRSMPGGRVRRERAVLLVDAAAGRDLVEAEGGV
jgi:6-phosphogluconolactonase